MSDASELGRRERKRKRTRSDLMTAAIELAREKDFDEITVQEITDRADYAPRTFFRHFPTKEDVLFGDHPEMVSDTQALIRRAPEDQSPLDVARAAIALLTSRLVENHEFALLRNEIASRNRLALSASLRKQHEWVRAMTMALADRMGVEGTVDLRPAAIAGATSVSVYNAALRWSRSPGSVDLEKEALANFETILEGIPT